MNTFKMELKRAITGIGMVIALCIGLGCVCYKHYAVYERIQNSAELAEHFNVHLYNEFGKITFYEYWMPGAMETGTLYMFYFMGLIAALPFGISFYRDRKAGVMKNICIRSGKRQYLLSKYAAVYISGGLAVTIPLVVDFMIAKIWVPIDYVRATGSVLTAKTEWGVFVIDHIYLAAGIIMVSWFLFGGALATISLMITSIADNFFTIQLTPFFVMLALFYLPTFFPAGYKKFFPFYFLTLFGGSNPVIAIVVSVLLALLTFTIFMRTEHKKDIL